MLKFDSPLLRWSNVFLVLAVTITIFLAFNVIIQNALSSVVESEAVKFATAGSLALLLMLAIILATSLRRDLLSSFCCCRRSRSGAVQNSGGRRELVLVHSKAS